MCAHQKRHNYRVKRGGKVTLPADCAESGHGERASNRGHCAKDAVSLACRVRFEIMDF